ncbi:MAG: tetratricopeptide repeat protein [Acidobacteria bacterium]|nr:tetratricopeptide repeat protein [Acidobacteriota bacterium]
MVRQVFQFARGLLALSVCAGGLDYFSASGLLAASPAAVVKATPLQSNAKAALEGKAVADRKKLETFAAQSKDKAQAALAYLALGYSNYQQQNYSAAAAAFLKARNPDNLLRDYADYYAAMNAQASGASQDAEKFLDEFQQNNPASPLAPKAALEHAKLLIELQKPEEAAKRLEEALGLPQPSATYFLARAYDLAGRPLDAVATYHKVFFQYPASAEAAEANIRMQSLRLKLGKQYPVAEASLWLMRADALFAKSRWKDAESAYRNVSTTTSNTPAAAALRQRAHVRVAVCQYQAGATWPALNALQAMDFSHAGADAEADAERHYILSLGYRKLLRIDQMTQQLELLGKRYPQSPWYEKALISAGNNYLLAKDYNRAGDYYRLAFQNFPGGDGAAYGHWKVAWQAYRERKLPQARHLFEEHITSFPNSPQISAALYWLARLMERESPVIAYRYYAKLREAFPNYYYSLVAADRIAALPPLTPEQAAAVRTISLDKVQRRTGVSLPATLTPVELRAGDRVRLLESAWLIDWAVNELTPMLPPTPSASWAGGEIARMEELRGRHHVALRLSKIYVPSYFSQSIAELPPDVWRRLFPIPYWEDIKKRAAESNLDPYLVAGLIRQESEFNPGAQSRSNARGLMQLLPSTARLVARKAPDQRSRNYQLGLLFQPQFNLIYGTMYLKSVLDRFDGSMEQAIASYNAGPGRVQQWMSEGPYTEPAEFVESIPFTETREYVQAVLRNAQMYRKIYAEPSAAN